MTAGSRGSLVRGLRKYADRLDAESRLARHRLEIDNLILGELMKVSGGMRGAADTLEKLDG